MSNTHEKIKQQIGVELAQEKQNAVKLLKEVTVKTDNISKFSDMVVRAIDEAVNKATRQQTLEERLKSLDASIKEIKYGVINEVRELQKAASYLKGTIEALDRATALTLNRIDHVVGEEAKVEELAQKMKSGELDPASVKRGNKRNTGERPERLKNLRAAKKLIEENDG
jgi:galactokinase